MQQAEQEGGWRDTGKATTAITAKRFCKRVAGGWKQCDTEGERVDGISAHDAALGDENAVFDVLGFHSVISGDALLEGQEVATDDEGRAIPFVFGDHLLAGLCEAAVPAINTTTQIRHFPGGIQRSA